MTGAAQEYWYLGPLISFAAFVVSCLALGAIVWFNWGQHKVRIWRARRPFNAAMTLRGDEGIEYWDLEVPAHSEVTIQIRVRPRMAYKQLELIFGFEGDASKRPIPLRSLNTFIKVGQRRDESPHSNPDHYVDHANHYHIQRIAERTPPNTYMAGFVVQTKEAGKYPVIFELITDCGEAKSKNALNIIVIEQPVPDAGATPAMTRS